MSLSYLLNYNKRIPKNFCERKKEKKKEKRVTECIVQEKLQGYFVHYVAVTSVQRTNLLCLSIIILENKYADL